MMISMNNTFRNCLILVALCCSFISAQKASSANLIDAKQAEQIYKPSEVSKKPVVTAQPNAEYTKEALQHQITGIVYVWAVLRASGEVTDIKLRSGLPFGLSEKAMEAASKLKFVPGEKNGVPVSVRTILEYEFKLPRS